jgi:hypothetical protein
VICLAYTVSVGRLLHLDSASDPATLKNHFCVPQLSELDSTILSKRFDRFWARFPDMKARLDQQYTDDITHAWVIAAVD